MSDVPREELQMVDRVADDRQKRDPAAVATAALDGIATHNLAEAT